MDFSQIAVLLVVAAVFGIISRFLKQPLFIGYLIAGIGLATFGFTESQHLESLGKIGVTFLLFLLGLEMNLKELPSIGKVATLTGLGQIVVTSVLGFALVQLMGFGFLASIYIAVALTFSSTIIIVKLLSENKNLNSLYGKISVGYLLVQDLVAILILIFLSGAGNGEVDANLFAVMTVKVVLILISVWLLSRKVLPYFFDKFVAGSSELLFIVSVAWALGIASFIAGPIGFTLEIGGFLAGISLSNLPEHLQIASRTRPLRDFFLTIFFLFLGTKLAISGDLISILPYGLLLSLFVIIGHPIILFIILGILGYKKRTSFLVGITSAQISEFAFIIMSVGEGLGHIEPQQVSLIVAVGVITMTVSTYLITKAGKIYKLLGRYMSFFGGRNKEEDVMPAEPQLTNHIVLVGADRTGKTLYRYFKYKGIPFVVVDFNPEIYKKLTADNIPVIFGDITDREILEMSNVKEADMLISTIPSVEDNLILLEYLKEIKSKPISIMISQTRHDGLKLYEKGANYVIVPEVVAGDHIKHLLKIYGLKGSSLIKAGKNHFDRLIFS